MLNKPFSATESKFRGILSSDSYTLLLGAGISKGIIPVWSELTRSIVNQTFGTTYDAPHFAQITTQSGWSLDAWIQAAANEFVVKGRTLDEFNTLIETTLYSDIRQAAAVVGLEESLVLALNNPRLLGREHVIKLCDFLEATYGGTSLVMIAKILSVAYSKYKLPVSIITFNADTLLHTVLDLFLIRNHVSNSGLYEHPKMAYGKVFRGLHNSRRNLPIYHCHGAIAPTPPNIQQRRDSRDKLIFKEDNYLQASIDFTSWAQNIFLFHAQSSRFLIIGYSMADSDVRRWLYWTHTNSSKEMEATGRASQASARHFWITSCPKDADLKSIQETAMHHLGVRLCWIDEWDSLPDCLINLIAL